MRSDHERCSALRELLKDGLWHLAPEMRAVGGDRYGARVHEIRRGEDGGPPIAVDCEVFGNVSRYRGRAYREGEERPGKSAQAKRVAELEARVRQLEEELRREREWRKPAQASLFGGG